MDSMENLGSIVVPPGAPTAQANHHAKRKRGAKAEKRPFAGKIAGALREVGQFDPDSMDIRSPFLAHVVGKIPKLAADFIGVAGDRATKVVHRVGGRLSQARYIPLGGGEGGAWNFSWHSSLCRHSSCHIPIKP
jgi:hypothetical protein